MPLALLTFLFLLVAVAYSSVGFGGGSSYNALLVLAGVDYRAIPAIALTCNILVVSGGVFHFYRAGQLRVAELFPFAALSIPFAWLGGRLEVSEATFTGLLGLALMVTAMQLLWQWGTDHQRAHARPVKPWLVGLPAGAGIGLLSGVVGIGGGIFLAPVLYVIGWGRPRQIAALASAFILVNSLAGLIGQLMKQGQSSPVDDWWASWPLFLAVLAGGQIGSRLASRALPETWVQRLTGLLILYVSVRLLARWFSQMGLV